MDFLHNFKDKNTSSIFGRLDMEISTSYKDDKIIYDLVSYLTFYNDIIDYNIDPYSWKSKNDAYVKSQQNEKINNKGNNEQAKQGLENAIGFGIISEGDESDNEEDEKSSNRPSRIDDLVEGGRRLSKDP